MLTPDMIAEIWAAFLRRVEAIRMVGGIALVDAMNGREVPKGWKLDYSTDYYVPPDFDVVTTLQ